MDYFKHEALTKKNWPEYPNEVHSADPESYSVTIIVIQYKEGWLTTLDWHHWLKIGQQTELPKVRNVEMCIYRAFWLDIRETIREDSGQGVSPLAFWDGINEV